MSNIAEGAKTRRRGDLYVIKHQDVDPRLNALAERVIGAAISVHRELGPGFQEITYGRALAIELEHRGIAYEMEVPVTLTYREKSIGEGKIDFLIDRCLVIELKAVDGSAKAFHRQVVAYLKASKLELGLVINFNATILRDGITRVANTKS